VYTARTRCLHRPVRRHAKLRLPLSPGVSSQQNLTSSRRTAHGVCTRVGPYPYKILSIFYCNKRGRGGNILRNIVGNKGRQGAGYCTIMCNNMPISASRTIFFSDTWTHPSEIRDPKKTKTPQNSSKTPQNWAGGYNNW